MKIDLRIEFSAGVLGLFDELRRKLDLIKENQETIMATKEEVKQDLANLLTETKATRGAAESAIVWAKGLVDQIANAAANASDLDGLRSDIALIQAEAKSTEDQLKAAIPANPA